MGCKERAQAPGIEDWPSHLALCWHGGLHLGRRADSIVVIAEAIRTSRAVSAINEINEKMVDDILGQAGRAKPRTTRREKVMRDKVEKRM